MGNRVVARGVSGVVKPEELRDSVLLWHWYLRRFMAATGSAVMHGRKFSTGVLKVMNRAADAKFCREISKNTRLPPGANSMVSEPAGGVP